MSTSSTDCLVWLSGIGIGKLRSKRRSAGHNYPRSAPPRWDVGLDRWQLSGEGSHSIQIFTKQAVLHLRQYTRLVFQRQLCDRWAWDHCLSVLLFLRSTSPPSLLHLLLVTGDYLQASWLFKLLVGLSEQVVAIHCICFIINWYISYEENGPYFLTVVLVITGNYLL